MAQRGPGDGGDADLAEQWRALGADPEKAAQAHAEVDQPEPDLHEVWPEHQEAWQVFMAVANTQWRVIVGFGSAAFQGLDYGAVETAMRLYQVPRKNQRAVFDQVQVLEDEALKHLNNK